MTQHASQSSERARVLFVDREPMVRAAVSRMLDQTPDLCCADAIASADDLVAHVDRTGAHVVIIRLRPNLAGDLRAISTLVASRPAIPILVCPDSPDASALRDAIGAGASAVVTTDDEPATVLVAIREALAQRPFITPSVAELLAPRPSEEQ